MIEKNPLIQKFKDSFSNKAKIINYLVPILIIIIYLFLFILPKMKDVFLLWSKVSQLETKIVNTEKDWENVGSIKDNISRLNIF